MRTSRLGKTYNKPTPGQPMLRNNKSNSVQEGQKCLELKPHELRFMPYGSGLPAPEIPSEHLKKLGLEPPHLGHSSDH